MTTTLTREERIAELKERIEEQEKLAERSRKAALSVRDEYRGTNALILMDVEHEAAHLEDLAERHDRKARALRAELAVLEGRGDRIAAEKVRIAAYFDLANGAMAISAGFARYAAVCERLNYADGRDEALYESKRWSRIAATDRENAKYFCAELTALTWED